MYRTPNFFHCWTATLLIDFSLSFCTFSFLIWSLLSFFINHFLPLLSPLHLFPVFLLTSSLFPLHHSVLFSFSSFLDYLISLLHLYPPTLLFTLHLLSPCLLFLPFLLFSLLFLSHHSCLSVSLQILTPYNPSILVCFYSTSLLLLSSHALFLLLYYLFPWPISYSKLFFNLYFPSSSW